MAGIKPLRKIQMGPETVMGTAVAATALWRGMGTIEDMTEPVFVEEDTGLLVPSERAYIPSLGAEIAWDSVPATFEQLPYIFEGGVKLVQTGAADGVGTGKVYNYPWPTTTIPIIKTYTIEGGDNQQAEEVEYCFVREFKIDGKPNEAINASATWQGRQVTKTTFTAAIGIPTVEDIVFNKAKLYIDPDSGSFGATQKANTFLGFALSVTTGWIARWTGDGNLYFSFAKYVKPEVSLEVTFEHDGTAVAEKDAWLAKTTRLMQIKAEGSALATPGTLYSFKTFIINLAGRWSKFSKIGELDGNDIVTGTLLGRYSSVEATMGNFIVVNELATLP